MSDIGKIIRVNALPPPDKRENNVIYQVAAPGAATYKDYAIDANGDLKTPSYIPLTGTVEGKPLTKNIEVDFSKEGAVGFIANTPDFSEASVAIQEDGSVLAESRKDTEGISSSIHLHYDTGVEISATTPDDQFSAIIDTSGLQGNDYIPPASDKHYVQKKYITDNFTSQTTLNSTLTNYYTKPETYSKTEVDAKLSAVYRPKGSVANFAALPTSGNTEGDVWNVLDTGANYVWVTNLNGTGVAGWDKLSETVDLTAYYTQNQINSILANYIDANGNYNIFGKKWFKTDNGNDWDNNTLRVQGINGHDAGLTFFRDGIDVGQIIFDGYYFNLANSGNTGYKELKTAGYIKIGSDGNHVLLGDGNHKAISDFALTTDISNVHKFDSTDGIDNGSATRTNKSWFDYNWAGIGGRGSVINFSGLNNNYSTELFANYEGGNSIGVRTRNGDTSVWNPIKWLYHTGNFNPDDYVDKTTNNQSIIGRKLFNTIGAATGSYADNSLFVLGLSGNNAAMTFQKDGVNTGQIAYTGFGFHFLNSNSTGCFPLISDGFVKNGSDDTRVLLGGGGHKSISDFVLDADLSNYVTINTPQEIQARKAIQGATGNRYDESAFEVRGNGSTIYPTLGFHQPGQYAGTISLRAGNFHFRNSDDTAYNSLFATGFVKDGSDNNRVLLAGGSDKLITDFALSSQLGNYLPLSGGTLTGGGRIEDTGNIYLQQTSVGGNATGLHWEKLDNTERIAGIGALTTNGVLDHTYMGWGASPWDGATSLSVGDNVFTYKNEKVFHSGETINYSDTLTNIITAGGSGWNRRKLLSRAWNPTYGFYTEINVPNSIDNPASFILSENGNGYIGNKTIWHEGNFIPGSKANAMQNCTGIGFSSGNLPTNNGVEYPYFYYDDGTNQGFIAMATQDWVNTTFATKNQLNDYVTRSNNQIIDGSKTFSSSSIVDFKGNDLNNVIVHKTSAGVTGLVSGHEYTHYNTRWRVGNKRGNSTNSLGYSFEFSNDGGAIYTEKARIDEAGFFLGNAFASPVINGAQVFNANNTNQLFFGNDVIPTVFYQGLNEHIFQTNSTTRATINNSGLSVVGNISANGSSVITEAQRGAANGFAPLGSDIKIPSAYLPSYIDDVLEFANLASFPSTGETGKIYVALDTNLTYRWGGSSYTQIAAGAVQSVNGQTGVVNLSKTDIGLANVDNTSDATKNVLSATKWTTPRTLSYTGDVTGSASVDGSGNVGFAMTLANSGVSAGTYNSVNVDAKGRVLSGSNINYVTESYLTTFLQQNYFNQTASDERFVNTNGDEVINGNKTFTSSPTIPAATNGDHAVNLEQLTASLSSVIRDNDDFELLEVYRLIDSTHFDLDDTRVKKYNIVFEDSSNGSVNIISLRDNQYYQFSNVSGSGADLRISVEGYGMVDVISSGKTAVYMSWGGGKLLKISENDNISII